MEFNKIVVQDALFSAFTYNADGNGKDRYRLKVLRAEKLR